MVRRRDFLKVPAAGLLLYAVPAVLGRELAGDAPPPLPRRPAATPPPPPLQPARLHGKLVRVHDVHYPIVKWEPSGVLYDPHPNEPEGTLVLQPFSGRSYTGDFQLKWNAAGTVLVGA